MKAKEFISEAWDDIFNYQMSLPKLGGDDKKDGATTDQPENPFEPKTMGSNELDPAKAPSGKGFQGSALKDPQFMPALQKVAQNLGVDANALLAIMKMESGLDPSRVNSTSGATGLIQFMPKTAVSLGTSTQALAKMSAVQQLPYVEKYLKGAGVRPGMDLGDLYMSVFMPSMVGKPNNTVISTPGKKVYDQNKGLDKNKDGYLTVADVKNTINNRA